MQDENRKWQLHPCACCDWGGGVVGGWTVFFAGVLGGERGGVEGSGFFKLIDTFQQHPRIQNLNSHTTNLSRLVENASNISKISIDVFMILAVLRGTIIEVFCLDLNFGLDFFLRARIIKSQSDFLFPKNIRAYS